MHEMREVKVCPDCATEYFAHIKACADCGTPLLLPEEIRKAQEEKDWCRKRELQDRVPVRDGDLQWMQELQSVLIESGIPCSVSTGDGCNNRCSGGKHYLLVSSPDLKRARDRIDQYYAEIHPEIQASQEMVRQGRCPACGSPVVPDAVECSDCGLTLIISD